MTLWTIKKSPLHGVGLFAAEDIKEGELISWGYSTSHERGTFDGTILEALVCCHGDKDVMTWGPHMWINHSDTPNCACDDGVAEDELYALQDIPAGTELTIDYETVCDCPREGWGFTPPIRALK